MLICITEDASVYKMYDIDLGLDPAKNYTDAYCFSRELLI